MNFADSILTLLRVLVKFSNPLTATLGSVWAVMGLYMGAQGHLDWVQEKISAVAELVTGFGGAADFSVLSVANYLLPLNQLLGYIASYVSLLLVCAAIRIVKSWIPTVS